MPAAQEETAMVQPLNRLKESPSQTAGPYVHIGLTPNFSGIAGVYSDDLGRVMLNERAKGERISVRCRVIDGAGTPLRDALVEIWQADANGFYNSPAERRGQADPHFAGWGRLATDMTTGECVFHTIKPGRVPYPDGRLMAPHISFWIVARGINLGLHTRMYFADEEAANAEDPVLRRIEHQVRIPTLIAPRQGNTYIFDIHLQGERETIFFEV
jgi:protocatechuate 3,4-dioxygenase alpha subunit